jgi:hypothetical protein
MALFSVFGGAWLSMNRPAPGKDLSVWVFADSHFREYDRRLRPIFERDSKKTLQVDLIPSRAMDMRLPVLFMAPADAKEVPDAIEVEIASFGRYLRPRVNEVGFLPLNDYLSNTGFREITSLNAPGRTGWNARLIGDGKIYTFDGARWRVNPRRARPDAWIDRILPSRLTAGSKDGVIFAVPHDVHPVALAFRDDLFREAGVPLIDEHDRSTVSSWPEFQRKALRFQAYWREHGYATRHAMELPESGADVLSVMLLQRHINLVDADYRIHLNDPKVAQTLAFYAQLVAGDSRIGAEAAPGTAMEFKDLADGNFCAMQMPDWNVDLLRRFVPELAGKLRLIPLPRFDPSDAPTASYGGTLIGIPRGTRHPDAAWNLIQFLYFDPASLADRKNLGILPPLPEEWDNAEYQQPDPFFGGQKTLQIYAQLARAVAPVYTTPVNVMALLTLRYAQSLAVQYVRENGSRGLEAQCQLWLNAAAVDLRRRIDHSRFEGPDR